MNGLSWKKSTAFTSRSILAVVSATSALSAKCMCGKDFSRLEWDEIRTGRVAMTPQLKAIATAALIATPLLAFAQAKGTEYTHRRTGSDGKKYYDQTNPTACVGQPLKLTNKQGLALRRIDPD